MKGRESPAATVGKASESRELIDELVPGIESTKTLVQEIASARHEQSAGSEQIAQAVQYLNERARANTRYEGTLSESAEKLTGEARELQASVGFFEI